jgi:hypothetical protein
MRNQYKVLAERYNQINENMLTPEEEAAGSNRHLPEGSSGKQLIVVSEGVKQHFDIVEMWEEKNTIVVTVAAPKKLKEEIKKPTGAPTPKPVPPQPTKKVPFKKNPYLHKLKDPKTGSFGDLGKRLG